jgi:pimeloyl-ACP methyl ester carboxylesterase
MSDDLHELMRHAGETGPFVLVGHSLGGELVRVFAAA